MDENRRRAWDEDKKTDFSTQTDSFLDYDVNGRWENTLPSAFVLWKENIWGNGSGRIPVDKNGNKASAKCFWHEPGGNDLDAFWWREREFLEIHLIRRESFQCHMWTKLIVVKDIVVTQCFKLLPIMDGKEIQAFIFEKFEEALNRCIRFHWLGLRMNISFLKRLIPGKKEVRLY